MYLKNNALFVAEIKKAFIFKGVVQERNSKGWILI